jgi:hypothetical protein
MFRSDALGKTVVCLMAVGIHVAVKAIFNLGRRGFKQRLTPPVTIPARCPDCDAPDPSLHFRCDKCGYNPRSKEMCMRVLGPLGLLTLLTLYLAFKRFVLPG